MWCQDASEPLFRPSRIFRTTVGSIWPRSFTAIPPIQRFIGLIEMLQSRPTVIRFTSFELEKEPCLTSQELCRDKSNSLGLVYGDHRMQPLYSNIFMSAKDSSDGELLWIIREKRWRIPVA